MKGKISFSIYVSHLPISRQTTPPSPFLQSITLSTTRLSTTMKLHLLKWKVAKHLIRSATRLGVKAMKPIHPVLTAKRLAVNAPASEVRKLSSINLPSLYTFS